MMTSIAFIGAVIILEARPVYAYLGQRLYGGVPSQFEMIVGFGLAAVVCLAATLIPIRIALRRLSQIER
jgi:hypothetical protein